jgi:fructokinase
VTRLLGAVELGGTRVMAAVGTGPRDLRQRLRLATQDPATTLSEIVSFLRAHRVKAVGVGSFGPLANRGIADTPKPGWSGTRVAPLLEEALGVPVALDTDVNAAALGEASIGCGLGRDPFLYVTVGTGIGGGLLRRGLTVPGLEMGHVRVPHDGSFAGVCPFHGDCLEGLASGPAIAARWGAELPEGHAAWTEVGRLVGVGLAGYALTLAPGRICLGGGIGGRPEVLAAARASLAAMLAGYPRQVDPTDLVVAPALGDRSGIVGAMLLAAAIDDD